MKNARIIRLLLIASLGAWISVGLIVVSLVDFSAGMSPAQYLLMLLDEQPLLWFLLAFPALAIILTIMSFRTVDQTTDRSDYFSALFQASPLAIVTLDLDQKIIAANPSFENLFGYKEKTIIGRRLDPLITSSKTNQEAKEFTKGVISGKSVNTTAIRRTVDGERVEVEIYGVPVEVNGEQVGIVGLYKDVSDRETARRQLRESEEKYRDIYENTIDFLYIHDLKGQITGANPAFVRASGFDSDTLYTMTIEDLMPKEHKRFFPYYLAKVKKKGQSEGILHIQTKARDEIVVEYKNSLIEEADGPVGIRGSARDITSRIELEQQLKESMSDLDKLARTDTLTGLLNRRGIYEHLEAEHQRAERLEIPLSVAMIDLDGLKQINDTYGHQAGDVALRTVASSVLKCIRSYDRVGRHGGDEFLIVFPGADLEQTAKVCSRITETVHSTNSDEKGLAYSTSIGFATFEGIGNNPDPESILDEVLSNADDALYKAKNAGGGKVVYYDPKQKELSKILS
jgi:diguanylate cyclase (GGDEF)-like protein/PAS domain S-box-containing protein